MNSQNGLGNGRMIQGIAIGLLCLWISFFTVSLMDPPYEIHIVGGMLLFCIIYFVVIFPHISIIVPENEAWILSNPWVTESSERKETFSGYREIRAQTEAQSGFHWTYLGETKGLPVIDMQRTIPVESKPDETYTIEGGKSVKVKYLVPVAPLPGYIVNFNRTKEEHIIRIVKARMEKFLQGYFGGLKTVSFDKEQLKKIKAAYEKDFKGLLHLDDEEKQLGIWVGDLQVYDIGNPESVEAAKNFETEMDAAIKVANKMVATSNDKLSFDMAYKMVLVGKSKANFDFVELGGLLNPPRPQGKGKNKSTP